MIIDKSRLLDTLRRRGQGVRADWVDRELPDRIDTYHNAGLLATLRLSADDLAELADSPP
jgi:hypothetical protein